MNPTSQPLISIGMPVHNGERYVREALGSLLAQDYPHFELIISDNNSQDGTEQICRELAEADTRIRYIRQTENHGAAWNFEVVFREARGAYFMWAAHDDLWELSYIRKCLEMLQSHPQAVLCCTDIKFIDAEGATSPYLAGFKNLETSGLSSLECIHLVITQIGWYAIYGLLRSEAVRKVKSLGKSAHGIDVVMTLELVLQGHIVKAHECLFYYRIVKPKTPADFQADLNSERDPAPASPVPYTGLATSLLRTVYESGLSSAAKTAAFADFISVMSSETYFWRRVITQELMGPNIRVNDAGVAYLLGQILARAVPLAEMKQNPLMRAIYHPPQVVPGVLSVVKGILSPPEASPIQAGTASAPHSRPANGTGGVARQDSAKDSPEHWKRREGTALFEQGKFEEASHAFGEALLEEETTDLWTDWATAQLVCKRAEEAECGLRRALDLDESNTLATLKLGVLMANLGRPRSAIPYLERSAAVITGPQRSEIIQLLTACQMQLTSGVPL